MPVCGVEFELLFQFRDELFPRSITRTQGCLDRFLRRPLCLPGERIFRNRAAVLLHFGFGSQCHTPNFRSPHAAARPNKAMKATPTARSTVVLLLQDWSTATSQTRNSPIAPTARIFSNMTTPA